MIDILVDIYCISTIICVLSEFFDNMTKNKLMSYKELMSSICPIVNTIKAIKHIYTTINNIEHPKR